MELTARLLNATEVAVIVGCSVPTLNMWYKWRDAHADDEKAKILPDFLRENGGTRGTNGRRLWRYEDIAKIIEFKQNIKIGRNGFLGEVTQKYVKKKETE